MLSLEAVACRRGGRIVFADLDLTCAPGACLVVTGPNGTGKSTLLRLIALLVPALAGEIAWNGDPVRGDADAHRARTRYLAHGDAIKPALSVRENVADLARLQGATGAAADRAIERVGLASLAGLPGRVLSAGQRRRVALARVLAAPGRLWLLDEPTTALDAGAVAMLVSAIEAFRADGGAVVLTTHTPLALADPTPFDISRFATPHMMDIAL